jgi:hypothetical protein
MVQQVMRGTVFREQGVILQLPRHGGVGQLHQLSSIVARSVKSLTSFRLGCMAHALCIFPHVASSHMCLLPRLVLPPPQVYMAPRPAEADAVLAVRSKLRANTNLRQAARQAGVPVYAIKSASSSNLVRAFKTLLGQEPSAGGVGGVLGGAGAEGAGGGSSSAWQH